MENMFVAAIKAENQAKMAMIRLKKDILKDVSSVKDGEVSVSSTGVCVVVPWDKVMETKSLKTADYDPKEQAAAVRSVLARARWLETPWELWCVLQEDDLPSWEIARRLAADFPTVRPVGEAQFMELLRK